MRYRASPNDDGTYAIYGVPVFSAVPKGEHKAVPVEIDAEWLQDAISTARMREERGYKYRLHLEHHGDKPTEPAGYFRLSHIADLDVEGEPVPTVFADFYQVPGFVFESIMRGEYPYRSVEIVKPKDQPEINTLALLSTHAPFFKYAALDRDSIDVAQPLIEETAGLVGAFSGDDGRTVALFHDQFSEVPKMERKGTLTVADGSLVLKSSESSATFTLTESNEPRQGEFCVQTPEGVYVATFEDSDKDDEGGEMAELKAKLKAMEEENKELKAKLKEASAAAKANDDDSDSARFAALETALEEEKSKREAKETADAEKAETEARFKAAKDSLKGWHVSDDTEAKLAKFAAMGQEPLDEFVAVFKTHVPKDGPATFAESITTTGNSEHATAVAKFLADNPDKTDKAAEVVEVYNAKPAMFRRANGEMIPLEDVLAREAGGTA